MRERLRQVWATIQREVAPFAAWVDRESAPFFRWFGWFSMEAWHGFPFLWPHVPRWWATISKSSIVRGAAGILVFALIVWLWWALGFYLPKWQVKGELENPGNFGDMFGAASALFSALAFFAVLFALYYQRKEMAANEESQRKQIDIAQITARIQAFTSLAELQSTLMKDAKPRFHDRFQHRAVACIARAVDLMRLLEEDFPEMTSVTPEFFTASDYARFDLIPIADEFRKQVAKIGAADSCDSNKEACETLNALHGKMRDWLEEWKDIASEFGDLHNAAHEAGMLANKRLGHPRFVGPIGDDGAQRRVKTDWNTFWRDWAAIVNRLNTAFDEFDAHIETKKREAETNDKQRRQRREGRP